MVDVHDKKIRSKNMSAIKSRNTKPELVVRKALYSQGFRYRLHVKEIPGKPDLVFSRYKAVLFINGCFWHRHDCYLFKWPKTRQDFWERKIFGNVENDKKKIAMLDAAGWRVGVVWECAIKGKSRISENVTIQSIIRWLKSKQKAIEVQGLKK